MWRSVPQMEAPVMRSCTSSFAGAGTGASMSHSPLSCLDFSRARMCASLFLRQEHHLEVLSRIRREGEALLRLPQGEPVSDETLHVDTAGADELEGDGQ